MKKNKRTNAERRQRAELARQSARQQVVATPYHGDRYRTDDLAPLYLSTEAAIHECDVISRFSLADRDVRGALERLIVDISRGGPQVNGPHQGEAIDWKDFIVDNILRHWKDHFSTHPSPGNDALIGALRTLLGSIQNWGSSGPRGYLHFVQGFLKKAGVSVRRVSAEEVERLSPGITRRLDTPENTVDLPGERRLPSR